MSWQKKKMYSKYLIKSSELRQCSITMLLYTFKILEITIVNVSSQIQPTDDMDQIYLNRENSI